MALETVFRRFSLLPGFIQTGNGEPRNKAHWLGNKTPTTPPQDQNQRSQDDRPPRNRDTRGYRDLASLTLGEVDEAYHHFKHQLVASPAEGWIAKNYFCQIPLRHRAQERPPVVFGRVKTCYPGDAYVGNIDQLELYFPRKEASPDVLHIRSSDIALQEPTQSYCVGVKLYVSAEEMADFARSENIFIEKGFAPLYETGYIDLLEINEQNQQTLPGLYVVGSGWFASIPDSVQGELREQLRNLVRWNKVIFNYHPRRYSLQYRSLNDELDFQYGFTEQYLVAPQDTGQVLSKVEESFREIFMRGLVHEEH
jgi:hypothetical protein